MRTAARIWYGRVSPQRVRDLEQTARPFKGECSSWGAELSFIENRRRNCLSRLLYPTFGNWTFERKHFVNAFVSEARPYPLYLVLKQVGYLQMHVIGKTNIYLIGLPFFTLHAISRWPVQVGSVVTSSPLSIRCLLLRIVYARRILSSRHQHCLAILVALNV